MSRNIRQKYPAAAAKAQKRRRGSDTSSSLDLSDEEGYSAVEDISDSEDNDEEDVIAVEEEMILTEGLPNASGAPRPLSDDDAEEEDAGNDNDDDDDDEDDDDVEEEAEDEDDGDADNTSWAGILSEVDDEHDFYHDPNAFASDPVVERHVRFDVPDSDSDSTETEDDHADLFPDIFVSQNALDPAFRKEIEHDPDESSGSNSFWDYHGHYEEEEEEDSDSEAEEEPLELDGYESDGDTTDEEDIPEPIIRKRSRRQSNAMSDDEASNSEADSPVKPERGQPRVGRFNLDRSDKKPIAVLNPLTRKMMIFTPTRRHQLDLSPEQFNFPWAIEAEHSPSLLSNSANMMLSAMFSSNTFGDFVNAQAMGPAEAFFPFPSEANADDSSTAHSMEEEEEEDDEEKLNINDFITFGEGDDDESSGDEGNDNKWRASPNRPTTASSDMGEVLSHLNPNTVGAFRRNQINQQLILSNQATQDSLAFSGPYNYTALRGLKSDRFDTAAIPLTPARRHKKQLSDMARGPVNALSAKRKATSEASGSSHKKHRSISSEVNALGL
ncbi:hypothetical protein BBK36DRAFT_1115054 [Trichoderma citrinoviride]|uniref:Uncharacterized protein n=1 Tax=Trichoderma citrinoviride TaxID=58853 RepID=A0A2T4BFR3_9HYPO|nr:hypothetical protein BBK36DRAFT_1115054 [Trichoderma citrinoviride]PTB68101.1 hypothetical protein BBK36DRAFT_1115054 [Trichoderma citrinoviride]